MSKSREERYRDSFAEVAENGEETLDRLGIEPEKFVRRDDERLWALYQTVADSQRDALDKLEPLVTSPQTLPSQSTASRVLTDMDEEILTRDVQTIGRIIHEDDLEHHPEPLREAYREVLADAMIRFMALGLIEDAERKTPEWATEMYPELVGIGPVIGRSLGLDESIIVDESGPFSENP